MMAMMEKRFKFGENWGNYSALINKSRINNAENSLKQMLGIESLEGKTFLDIGCGSGLFSLAAKNLGAKVTSFDYDIDSVNCTQLLKKMYYTDNPDWIISLGDVLSDDFMLSIEQHDIVYSWGVLHHTGDLWQALANSCNMVNPGGAIYCPI